MSRWKASAIHVCISAAIAALMVGIMWMLWYPPPYFDAMGGGMLIALIVGCDVTIGPLITLIIFKSGKKGLNTDLAIIGCVQLAALAYGTYTIFIARPVFTVFAVDRFEVVAANGIKSEDLAKATSPAFSSLSFTGPRVVAARLPSDPQERSQLMINRSREATISKTCRDCTFPTIALQRKPAAARNPSAAWWPGTPAYALVLMRSCTVRGSVRALPATCP